jgi:hypothetical protein
MSDKTLVSFDVLTFGIDEIVATKSIVALTPEELERHTLMIEIAKAKTKRNIKLAARNAEIDVLEAKLAALKAEIIISKPNVLEP